MYFRHIHRPKFYGLFYDFRGLLQNAHILLGFTFVLLMVSACNSPSNTENVYLKSATDQQDRVLLPPGRENLSLQPGQSNVQMMSNGLPALQPLKGVKVDQLFLQNIRDANKRFSRLENAVTDMRREFEAVKPAIIRLVAVEADIQQLIDALEVTLRNEISAKNPDITPVFTQNTLPQGNPVPLTQDQVEKIEPAVHQTQTNGAIARQLRIGLHDTFTRIVVDIDQKTPYSLELDNQEKFILIELPEASWKGEQSKIFYGPLVESYTVQSINGGAGIRVVLQLKAAANVLQDKIILPGKNSKFRIFVDITGNTVSHK